LLLIPWSGSLDVTRTPKSRDIPESQTGILFHAPHIQRHHNTADGHQDTEQYKYDEDYDPLGAGKELFHVRSISIPATSSATTSIIVSATVSISAQYQLNISSTSAQYQLNISSISAQHQLNISSTMIPTSA